jgi:SAM-dependent methyltransferase
MSKRKRIRDHYEPRIHPLRESFDILDWSNAASQIARFEALADNVDLAGKSLLDVGCGLGDLWKFLASRHVPVTYTGVDLLENMVLEAGRRCPGVRFVAGDVFAENVFGSERFDVVFCSGAFNLNLGNNREFLALAVPRVMELSRESVVFNLLHKRARRARSRPLYYYSDPQEVLEMLKPLGWKVRIVDDYLPNDFTTICEKGASPL